MRTDHTWGNKTLHLFHTNVPGIQDKNKGGKTTVFFKQFLNPNKFLPPLIATISLGSPSFFFDINWKKNCLLFFGLPSVSSQYSSRAHLTCRGYSGGRELQTMSRGKEMVSAGHVATLLLSIISLYIFCDVCQCLLSKWSWCSSKS